MAFRTETYKFTTLQQLFDDVYLGILKQGCPSVNASGACSMRGKSKDGEVTACAVGMILRDDVVDCGGGGGEAPSIGGYRRYADECGLTVAARWLICRLQDCHDSAALSDDAALGGKRGDAAFIESFKSSAGEVAAINGLTVPAEAAKNPLEKYGRGSKRYAASVLRRAAKLLEDNPGKHVVGYGNPSAPADAGQCFCAVAAIDMTLSSDGFEKPQYGLVKEHGTWRNALPALGEEAPYADVVKRETGGLILYRYNDTRASTDGGAYNYLTPKGSAQVIRVLRRAAARLEHGGEVRSPKKAKKGGTK